MGNAAQLKISSELADKIRAHGVETYPHECCGALLGRDTEVADRSVYREIHALFPLVNRRDDSPRNRFSVTAKTFWMPKKPLAARTWKSSDGIIRIRTIPPGPVSTIATMPGRGTATSSSAWPTGFRKT